MIAAIYARKSTDQNGVADDAKSVTRQIEHARAYAIRKGWSVDDSCVFVDDGVSGAEFANRPGFLRLMNALKPKPRFQALVMSEESRLGREAIETAYALKQIVTVGVRVFFYMEDRERTLDSPTDKIMLSLTAFSDELEREKARQRTYDAMVRKARAGHVTGGRVFGYDNERVDGHVVRHINRDEAAVVRRIFDLCVKGHGKIAIAKLLNAEGAPAPRSQQGRPRAWAPSSVREVLYRETYRGVVVWNRSRKRDTWGKVAPHARPESDWLRVPVPKLRIVSDDLWQAAHARLDQTREAYLRNTNGKLWGHPLNGIAAKYLLTGLARCGFCGGSLEVRSRSHGRRRVFFYACSSYYRRGRTVCPNRLEVPLVETEAAVIAALEQELLTPDFAERIVRKVLTRAVPTGPALDEARAKFQTEHAAVVREIDHLTETLATVGVSRAVTDKLKAREARRDHLERELVALLRGDQVAGLEVSRLEGLAREKVLEWRGLLRRHVPQARQILRKMLRDRLVFRPERRGTQQGYRFTGEGTIMQLLTGLVPDFSQAVASPTGDETQWTRKIPGEVKAA